MSEQPSKLDAAIAEGEIRWADLEAHVLDLERVDVVLHGDGPPMVIDQAGTNHRARYRELRRLVLRLVAAREAVLRLDSD